MATARGLLRILVATSAVLGEDPGQAAAPIMRMDGFMDGDLAPPVRPGVILAVLPALRPLKRGRRAPRRAVSPPLNALRRRLRPHLLSRFTILHAFTVSSSGPPYTNTDGDWMEGLRAFPSPGAIDARTPAGYLLGMSTVAEIEAALPNLTNEELARVEQAVHNQFRQRGEGIVYDDAYGVETEADLIASADQAFLAYDRAEAENDKRQPR